MKKTGLFVLALSTVTAVFAQTNQQQLKTPMAKAARFGIRGGVNLADLTSKNTVTGYSEAQAKTAFNGGFFINIPLGASMFRFQPEIAYSSQGGKVQGPSGSAGVGTFEQDLDYVTVPLNFQLKASNGLFIQTGPQLGYLVGAEIVNAAGGTATNGGNKDDFDKFDLSWTGGVGYLSRIGLGIDLRYNIGIANVVSDAARTAAPFRGETWKNSVGQFSLIYHFGAHK